MQEWQESHLYHSWCELHLRLEGEIHPKTEFTHKLGQFTWDVSQRYEQEAWALFSSKHKSWNSFFGSELDVVVVDDVTAPRVITQG